MTKKLEDFLDRDFVLVRETKSFSFGELDYCKNLLTKALILTDKTIQEGKFEWLPEYDEIAEWMHDTKGKGIFLVGSCGRGKSAILNGAFPLLFNAVQGIIIRPIPARHLHTLEGNYKKYVAIDDVGAEDIVNKYGTKVDAVEDAISHCEDRMKLLLATSNLNKEQIVNRYGVRIMDRINRLCKIVVFKGESKRK